MTAPPDSRDRLDHLAGALAAAGAGLGIIAGIVDVAVGGTIRDWVGNKLDTTTLGAGTIALSAVALVAAIAWQRPNGHNDGRRLATILALAVPAAICFTTIGRLWYIPGLLLLAATVLIVLTSSRRELTEAVDEHRWRIGLTAVLAGYDVFLGADALPKAAGLVGILGGLAVWLALWVAPQAHRLAVGLLAVGALAFAIVTWWSAITPIIAILLLTLGPGALRPRGAHRRRRGGLRSPAGALDGAVRR